MLLMRGADSSRGGIRKFLGKSSKKGFKTPAPPLAFYSDDHLLLLYRQVTAALANTSDPGNGMGI